MNSTANLFQDRRAVANLNAVGSGIPVAPPANLKDASNRAGPSDEYVPAPPLSVLSTQAALPPADPGNTRPPKSSRQSTRARPLDPYGGGRMSSNLHSARTAHAHDGNHTASRTVLGQPGSSGRSTGLTGLFGSFGHPPAKRQKTGHHRESQFFTDGAAGTGKGSRGKGKGKEPAHNNSKLGTVGAGTMEAIEVSDDEVPARVFPEDRKGRTSPAVEDGERHSSSDPLDCIGPSPERPKPPSEPPDPFACPPSPRPRPSANSRLPADGTHTRQLQKKHRMQRQRASPLEIVDVDTLSDPIESATEFDREDEARARAAEEEAEAEAEREREKEGPRRSGTPSGRSNIRPGSVMDKVRQYEDKGPAKAPPKPLSSEAKTPFIDLKGMSVPKSRKAGMKGKNQKPLSSTSPPSHASVDSGPLDSAATSSSGFKARKGKADTIVQNPIPVEAWTLGCRLSPNENGVDPVAWIHVEHIPKQRTYMLRVSRSPQGKRDVELSIMLDRDADQLEYTDPDSTWDEDSVAVVKLHTTNSLKVSSKPQEFKPGDKHAKGYITFKFMTRHANFTNGNNYKALVHILKDQIQAREVHRGKAGAGVWQMSKDAIKLEEAQRQRQTRSNTSLKRQSPLSAGPANDDSMTVVASEYSSASASASAPPSRTYGTERRTTRQSARIAQRSPSPMGDPDELLLVYPPTGTGAVNITRGDLKRLDDGQYLNDTLIEFGLKLWLDDLRRSDPEKAEQVHVFNSFFYKKLSSKKDFAEAYPSVRKWSSKVDIFSKKYIIVPINENFHWYLAIIENPADMLHPPPPEARAAPQTRKRKRESAAAEAEELLSEDKDPPAGDSTETATDTSKQPSEQPEPSTPPGHVPDAMVVDGDSEGDRQEVDSLLGEMTQTRLSQMSVSGPTRSPSVDLADGELQYPGSEPMDVDPVPLALEPEEARKPSSHEPIVVDEDADMDEHGKAPEAAEGDSKPDGDESTLGSREEEDAAPEAGPSTAEEQPQDKNAYVYTFDSLGSRHGAAASKLAKYLRFEAQDKKGLEIDDTRLAIWKNAKSPMQTNFCDCGLFVLAFVEAFMKDPARAGEVIRHGKEEWYEGRRVDFREPFRKRTIALSEEWKKGRAAKEDAKAGTSAQEGPTDDGAGDKEKEKEEESAKEAEEKPKPRQPETTVVEDSSDDEIIISEVRPPPKANRGGKKGTVGKAARLR